MVYSVKEDEQKQVLCTGQMIRIRRIKQLRQRIFSLRQRANYTNAYKKNRIQNNIILYEAVHGSSMTGNVYALFKTLLLMQDRNFIHVWVNKKGQPFDTKAYEGYDNVKFVTRNSKAYMYFLTSAKYLVNDSTFPPYFIKKQDQIYLNTWHGTPLKMMGKDMKGIPSEGKNVQRNFLQTDYLLAPNQHTKDVLTEAYDIAGIYPGKIIEEGYPRIDVLFDTDKVQSIIADLQNYVKLEPDKKIVVYAPTWRGTMGRETDVSEDIQWVANEILQVLPITHQLLLKVHPFAYQFLKHVPELQTICLPMSIDTDELLAATDVLITDYSSIFFDFYVTNKPIILFAYDYDTYVAERGLYLTLDELDVDVAFTRDEFVALLLAATNCDKKTHYDKAIAKYCGKNLVGTATDRIIDIVFNGNEVGYDVTSITNDKANVIVYGGGLQNNGISRSLINLTDTLDYTKFNLILITHANLSSINIGILNEVNKHVKILYRTDGMSISVFEWLLYVVSVRMYRLLGFMHQGIEEIYQREVKRSFGALRKDVAIDYSGYAPFWGQLVGYADAKKKVIVQHNDMWEESKVKYRRNLYIVFRLYRLFDVIACVGRQTMEANILKLTKFVDEKRFYYMPNNIDAARISQKAKEEMPLVLTSQPHMLGVNNVNGVIQSALKWKRGCTVFVTIGRLAPEKDQQKLITVFDRLFKERPMYRDKVKLYIVGTGKLTSALKRQVARCGLEASIIFTGQLDNPFPLLQQSNCYISSSNHEGQPMVLLEALVLKKDIIATNIAGNKSVLGDRYGCLVENSVQGLYNGVVDYLEHGQPNSSKLDVETYIKETKEKFEMLCLHEDVLSVQNN